MRPTDHTGWPHPMAKGTDGQQLTATDMPASLQHDHSRTTAVVVPPVPVF